MTSYHYRMPASNVGPVEKLARFIASGFLLWLSVAFSQWWFLGVVYLCYSVYVGLCPLKYGVKVLAKKWAKQPKPITDAYISSTL